MSSPSGTQSVDRSLSLLRLTAAHHSEGISIQQLVTLSGINRTTTHRLLQRLLHHGLIHRDKQKPIYRLGIETVALGSAAMEQSPVVAHYQSMVKALVKRSAASAFLVIRSGDYGHCVYYLQGEKTRSTFASNMGGTRLLGLGISSIALLASLSDAAIHAHFQRHQHTYRTHRMSEKQMMRWVTATREQGYAYINAQGVGGVGQHFTLGSCGDASVSMVIPDRLDQRLAHDHVQIIEEELQKIALY